MWDGQIEIIDYRPALAGRHYQQNVISGPHTTKQMEVTQDCVGASCILSQAMSSLYTLSNFTQTTKAIAASNLFGLAGTLSVVRRPICAVCS